MTKNCCGALMEFVWKKRPLKSKELVKTDRQVLNGVDTFVEVSRRYEPPGIPLVPLKTRLLPTKVAELMTGFGKAANRKVPFTASWLVSQASPIPVVGGMMFVNVPE